MELSAIRALTANESWMKGAGEVFKVGESCLWRGRGGGRRRLEVGVKACVKLSFSLRRGRMDGMRWAAGAEFAAAGAAHGKVVNRLMEGDDRSPVKDEMVEEKEQEGLVHSTIRVTD